MVLAVGMQNCVGQGFAGGVGENRNDLQIEQGKNDLGRRR